MKGRLQEKVERHSHNEEGKGGGGTPEKRGEEGRNEEAKERGRVQKVRL